MLRLFIALNVSDEIKEKAGKMVREFKAYDTDIKWVAPENIHITLKFLEATEDNALPGVTASLTQIATTYKPFYIKIYGTGTFPDKGSPRIIWVGAGETDMLLPLRRDIEYAMESLGYVRENKRFHPHLTVGRVRSRKGMKSLLSGMEKYRSLHFGEAYVDSVDLMKSDLTPQGAEYTCLHKAFFRGGDN